MNPSSGSLAFSAGGWQEARGSSSGGGYYVENILEVGGARGGVIRRLMPLKRVPVILAQELDAAGEWFLDTNAELYVCVNGSNAPNVTFVASQLDVLISLQVRTVYS